MAKETEGHDKALAAGLSKARTAKEGKPCFFAMVLKGSDGVLLVERKRIAPAKIQEAKKRCGGSTVVIGVCYGEEGKLIFETHKEPGGTCTAAAKKIAHEAAGMSIAPLFRLGRDPDTVAETTDEGETPEGEGQETTDGAAQQWAQRSKDMQPKLLAALKANQGDVSKLRPLFAFAQEKAAAHEYTKALAALDNLEKLLAAGGSAPTPSTDGQAGKVQALSAWQAAREKVVTQLKAVASAVAATKDPGAGQVIVVLQAIIKNLTPSPSTPQQIAELERYLRDDDVISAAEEVPSKLGALQIRAPLLQALAALKQ